MESLKLYSMESIDFIMNFAQSIVQLIQVKLNYSHYNVIVCVYYQIEFNNIDLNKIRILQTLHQLQLHSILENQIHRYS
jgi:hypothetical protein